MINSKSVWTILMFLMILAVATPVAAQKQDDEWQYIAAPYLVFASLDGTMGLRGLEADVDIYSLSHLQAGFLGYFEARKGNWGFGTDVVYMALGASTDYVNVDPSQAAFTFMGIRRLAPTVDLQFGVRWNVIRGQLEFKDNSPILAGQVFKQTKQWVDPVVGIVWKQPLGERWILSLPASVGGFGVSSKIAVDLFPNIQLRVGKNAWLGGGWRFIYMDYRTGYDDDQPILGEQPFKYDMITSGPAMGMVFRF